MLYAGQTEFQVLYSIVWPALRLFLISQRSLKKIDQNKECPESRVKEESVKKYGIVISDQRKFEDIKCLLILGVGLGGRRTRKKKTGIYLFTAIVPT